MYLLYILKTAPSWSPSQPGHPKHHHPLSAVPATTAGTTSVPFFRSELLKKKERKKKTKTQKKKKQTPKQTKKPSLQFLLTAVWQMKWEPCPCRRWCLGFLGCHRSQHLTIRMARPGKVNPVWFLSPHFFWVQALGKCCLVENAASTLNKLLSVKENYPLLWKPVTHFERAHSITASWHWSHF